MNLSIIALGATLLTASPALAATELVSNGGFETGSLSGWTLAGSTFFSNVQVSAHRQGAYGYINGLPGSTVQLRRTIATIAGRSYNYGFALANLGSGAVSGFAASLGGTAFGSSFTSPGQFSYTLFTGTVVAPTDNAVLSFAFRHDQSFWIFDDASLTAALPEPASWALMIAGFAATGVAMRRRRVAPVS